MDTAYPTYLDTTLIELLNQRDGKAYAEIYHRYWARMYLYAHKLLKDSQDAEDAVQEVLLDVWNKAKSLTLTSTLEAYLFTCVRYAALNIIDRRNTRTAYLDSLQRFIDRGEYVTDHQIREKELQQQIDLTIASLPGRMREIFELSRKEHLSHREIAERLGIAETTVKKQINKALLIFRSRFGALTPIILALLKN